METVSNLDERVELTRRTLCSHLTFGCTQLYGAFDKIAKRKGVFKVETVGDCYVGVCGLPQPRRNHAVVIARFAQHIMLKMSKIVHELEVALGPGTSELNMRFGIHSGPGKCE